MLGIADILRDLGENAVMQIRSNMAAAGQNATGKTAASLAVSATEQRLTITGRQAFWTLEQGRGPGRVPKNFRQIIAAWVIAKGLPLQLKPIKRETGRDAYTRALLAAAGAIAWNLYKRGTKLYRDGGRSDIYTPALEELENKIVARLIPSFDAAITENIGQYGRNNNKNIRNYS